MTHAPAPAWHRQWCILAQILAHRHAATSPKKYQNAWPLLPTWPVREPAEISSQAGVSAKTLRRDLELLQRRKTLCEIGRLD